MLILKQFNFAIGLLLWIMVGCAKPPKTPSIEAHAPHVLPGFPKELSLASFKTNVYSTILEPHCAPCHGNTFADLRPEAAHDAFMLRVDFDDFTQSDQTPVLTKLRQVHNCWQADNKICEKAMIDAIDLWLLDLKSAGFSPTKETRSNETQAVDFSSAQPTTVQLDDNRSLGASIEQAGLAEPFIKMTDDIDGAILSYAMGKADALPIEDTETLDLTRALTFRFNVTQPGNYQLWARIKTPTDKNNGFFTILNQNVIPFNTPVTGPDLWKWVQLTVPRGGDENKSPAEILINNPGPFELPIIFRAPEARINYVVLTQNRESFEGDIFAKKFYDLAVDLPIPNSRIIATIWVHSSAEGKKSIGVRELRIDSPLPLHIKGIYPLINGVFNRNHGTYTSVDTVAGGSTSRDSQLIKTGGARSTTWLADFSKDKVSFAFDVLEVAPAPSIPEVLPDGPKEIIPVPAPVSVPELGKKIPNIRR